MGGDLWADVEQSPKLARTGEEEAYPKRRSKGNEWQRATHRKHRVTLAKWSP